MKIAFLEITATTSFGGLQTGVWNFANEFSRAGHDVTVIGGRGKVENPFGGSIKTLTFPFTPRDRFPFFKAKFNSQKLAERISFASGRAVRAAVGQGKFDRVVLQKPLDFFWPWLPGIPRSTKFALMSGGTDFMPFDRRLGRRVRGLFGCSAFNAWQLFEHFHRQPKVVYYGVDTDKFAPQEARAEWRSQHGCSHDDVVFGFAGRLVDWKGVDRAVHAFSSEPLRDLPVKLLVAGDGPARAGLEELSRELGLQSRVQFIGPLAHASVASFYSSCDVAVFPSVADEAFGITIAEAMSCGIPVIGSYIGGIPEVVGNEENCGFLTPPGDACALAGAMRRLALAPELRLACGKRARERILRDFTWQRAASNLMDGLYAMEGKRSTRAEPSSCAPGSEMLATN